MNLGRVLEFACGPYTQTRNILERANVTLESITLSDPIIDLYKKIPGATYHEGKFEANGRSYPVVFNNETVEEWGHKARRARFLAGDKTVMTYDTVVFMNAMLYSKNAIHVVSSASVVSALVKALVLALLSFPFFVRSFIPPTQYSS